MSQWFPLNDQNTGFNFSISPTNEYSGLISLKINWFDTLAVQGTLKSLLQQHSLKSSVLWHAVLFTVKLSQLCVTSEKIIAITIQSFIGRVMSLLFSTLSRFVVVFLKSKRLLISWLQSPSTVILEPQKRKSVTTFTFSFSICHEAMGPDAMILVLLIFSFQLALSLSSFTLIKKPFSSSSLSAIRVVSSAHLRSLMFLPLILIPACNSPSTAFLIICSVYRLD